ncbi:MAG: RICIN domain-containing protein [Oscillospiraceae bacterium]|nr:RICIN domain-containing protein [Oscillospiraceae bacterium]
MGRILSLILVVSMVVSLVPIMEVGAETTQVTQSEAIAWVNAQLGKAMSDNHGGSMGECVAVAHQYYHLLTGRCISANASGRYGNGNDYADNNHSINLGWTRGTITANTVLEPGDIIVWGSSFSGDSGNHVGVFMSGTASVPYIAHQNWGEPRRRTVDIDRIWGNGVIGRTYVRPAWKGGDNIPRLRPETSVDIPNGIYKIQNRGSGKFIDLSPNKGNGALAQLWESTAGEQQQFRFQRQSDNTYIITALHSGLVLEVGGVSMDNEATLNQWGDANIASQRWYIIDGGSGYYKFVNKHSGLVMDVRNNLTANGTAIQQYESWGADNHAQQFRLMSHHSTSANIPNETFAIQHRGSGKYISIGTANELGRNAYIYEHGRGNGVFGDDQIFRFERQTDNSYILVSAYNNRVLDIKGGDILPRIPISSYTRNNTNAQRWFVVERGNSYYSFISKHTGMAIDVTNNLTANLTGIVQYYLWGDNNQAQQFRLIGVCLTCKKAPCECLTTPTAPQNFIATSGNGKVTITWTAPASNGGSAITRYEVSSNGGISWVTASSNTTHTFTGLTNGTSYAFCVRAVNSSGNGATASVTATPTTEPPLDFIPGRVLSNDTEPTIFDALEILKHLVGMDGVIKSGGRDSRAWNAALITEDSKLRGEPTIFDVLEILKYLVGINTTMF